MPAKFTEADLKKKKVKLLRELSHKPTACVHTGVLYPAPTVLSPNRLPLCLTLSILKSQMDAAVPVP